MNTIRLILWHTVGFAWLDVLYQCLFVFSASLFCARKPAHNHLVILKYALNPIGKRLVCTRGCEDCHYYLLIFVPAFPVLVGYWIIQIIFTWLFFKWFVWEYKKSLFDVVLAMDEGDVKTVKLERINEETTPQKMEALTKSQNDDLKALKEDKKKSRNDDLKALEEDRKKTRNDYLKAIEEDRKKLRLKTLEEDMKRWQLCWNDDDPQALPKW